jgi:orotidine-5'-phosphate decarboxylase
MDTENIDIRAWAKQIREIKIRELQDLIKYVEKEYKENQGTMFVVTRCHERARISELKGKLKILQTQ